MGLISFYLVDVFSERPLQGNPLALVPDAERIDDVTMRRLAREFNQSETTFLLPPTRAEADYRLRCFTPTGQEVFGAGHNALGAWWWLAESERLAFRPDWKGGLHNRSVITYFPSKWICEAGHPVSVGMSQTAPLFGETWGDLPGIAGALGLAESDVDVERLPIQIVSTGA